MLLTNAGVEEIVIENGEAVGVRLEDGRILRAALILSNAGASNTYGALGPERERARVGFAPALDRIAPSAAHLSLYIGLDKTAAELELPKANYWIYPANEYMRRRSPGEPTKARASEREADVHGSVRNRSRGVLVMQVTAFAVAVLHRFDRIEQFVDVAGGRAAGCVEARGRAVGHRFLVGDPSGDAALEHREPERAQIVGQRGADRRAWIDGVGEHGDLQAPAVDPRGAQAGRDRVDGGPGIHRARAAGDQDELGDLGDAGELLGVGGGVEHGEIVAEGERTQAFDLGHVGAREPQGRGCSRTSAQRPRMRVTTRVEIDE